MKRYTPKLQNCSLTIRWFSVISKTLVKGRVLLLCRDADGIYYSPGRLSENKKVERMCLNTKLS